MSDGLCYGNPEPWENPRLYPQAIATCCRCPLLARCAEAAIQLGEYRRHIWAGLTPSQRARMVDARAATVAAFEAPEGQKGDAARRAKHASAQRRWVAVREEGGSTWAANLDPQEYAA